MWRAWPYASPHLVSLASLVSPLVAPPLLRLLLSAVFPFLQLFPQTLLSSRLPYFLAPLYLAKYVCYAEGEEQVIENLENFEIVKEDEYEV